MSAPDAPHRPYDAGSAGTASAGYLVPSPRRPERETSDPDEYGARRRVPEQREGGR